MEDGQNGTGIFMISGITTETDVEVRKSSNFCGKRKRSWEVVDMKDQVPYL
jgi:hypothetical protein